MLNFGGFLSSNFWTNYRCQSSASVEDLLSSPDCTVDKLLDDDDCLQEFKNYNDKLIKYFDHDKLKVLVDYITVMPELDEQKRGHKYPFLAAEIFNCELNQVLDKFFEAPVKVKPQPAIAADTATEATDSSVTKDDEEVKKEDGAKDLEEAADEDKKEGDDKEETKEADATEKTAEDQEAAELAEGAKILEEAEAEKPTKADEIEQKDPVEETKKEEAVTDAQPPQDGESKEETKEETKKEASPVAPKEEEKEEAKTEKPDETKEVSPQKNTQEPESEEPEKENNQTDSEYYASDQYTKDMEKVIGDEKKAADDKDKKAAESSEEPEGEDKAKDVEKDLSTQASQQTLATEAVEEEEDEEEGNKYILLERLFKFIQTDEELNPVLSGYFCKLVSLLISRKQKSLFPFIFAPESTVIEDLLKHVYQKSISEILNKLLTLVDTDHEADVLAQIKSKQTMAVKTLIDSLGPEKSEEHNLNASTIILDMFEVKDFYNLILSKENLTRIVDFSLAGMKDSTKYSKCSSLTVLNQIVLSNIERQKKKEKKTDEDKDEPSGFGDDDMIVQQNSDDEKEEEEASNPNSATAQTNLIVEILQDKVRGIAIILGTDHEGATIASSVTGDDVVPLGMQRLYTIELVLRMVQLKQEALYTAMGQSEVFKNIIQLVKMYPWNNFMQLKVITMCDEIFENCENEQFKKDFLEGSGIGKTLVEMGAEASFKMKSERMIRNGYMGLVVSVSNKLIKRFKGTDTKPEDATIVEYLDNCGEEWRAFVDDELANSNANDSKTLGGSSKPDDQGSEEGGDNIDVQMDAIMRRFSNFNSMLNSGQNDQDNEEDGDADDTADDDKDTSVDSSDIMKLETCESKPIEPLEKDFIDSSFWTTPTGASGLAGNDDDIDYDSLYAELES